MGHLTINPIFNNSIQKYYEENFARIKIEEVTAFFQTTKGLRQGGCLSPTLFKIHLDRSLLKCVLEKYRNTGGRKHPI